MLLKFDSKPICVKITVYKGHHADKVVYYRGRISLDVADKWRWYFEYLAARIKVKNPIRHVELTICAQSLLLGDEYLHDKIKNLLIHRRAKLKKLFNTPVESDLFNYNQIALENQIKKISSEIASLERGEYTGWIPPYYINDVKDWI